MRDPASYPSNAPPIGELATARTFASWCVGQGWLPSDPSDGLEVTGARARGKAQLHIDEARRFVETALGEGDERGLAAAMALLMGLRASEITNRVVRDVDDAARVLWIERVKTRAGDRRLEVPEVLRPRLAALVAGRAPDAPLFGAQCLTHRINRHLPQIVFAGRLECHMQSWSDA